MSVLKEFKLFIVKVKVVFEFLVDGVIILFIVRYCKEMIGGMDEE